jgi:hypothetical protein
MEIKEVIKLSEREIKNALSEYVGKRGYTVTDVEFGFKQDFKNAIKVTDVKMEVREATNKELLRPFLPNEVARALDIIWLISDISTYDLICSLQSEDWLTQNGCKEEEAIKAHKELRDWAFEKGKGNMDILFKALTNGYERKEFWMKS